MREQVLGVTAMIGACLVWGLSPLFYDAIAHIPPLEVLSHRTVWSFVVFAIVLLVQGRLRLVFDLLGSRRNLILVTFSAVVIAMNWFGFIFAIQLGRTVEASLGYFLFPLTAALLGWIFFSEKLRSMQWVAMAITILAVIFLSVGLNAPPFIAIYISLSFGAYSAFKKMLSAGPIVSVTAEVLVLLPLALFWLIGVEFFEFSGVSGRSGGYFAENFRDSLFLVASGVVTATPLILFSYAAKRLRLATIGFLQLLNPSLQFTVAVLLLGEVITISHAIAFPMIWFSLILYLVVAYRRETAR